MNNFDKGENSINLAVWYREIPFEAEELSKHDGLITKECRRYLIGKICEREKNSCDSEERVIDLYARLGKKFGYTGVSVKNIVAYARAIDCFYRIAPDIASDILAGRTRLAHRDVPTLAKLKAADARTIIERLSCEKTSVKVIFNEQDESLKIRKKRGRPKQNFPDMPRISVKITPPYDPDSQTMALVYTIPSWINAIDRAFMNTDHRRLSQTALDRLLKELTELRNTADIIISMLNGTK